jgi:hypothetical protein
MGIIAHARGCRLPLDLPSPPLYCEPGAAVWTWRAVMLEYLMSAHGEYCDDHILLILARSNCSYYPIK